MKPISRLRTRARSDALRVATGRLERVRALGGGVEQPENREEGGLAAPRRPGNRDILPPRNRHVDVRERMGFDLVGREDLGDAVELNDGGDCLQRAPPSSDESGRTHPTPTCRTRSPDRQWRDPTAPPPCSRN